MIDIVKIVEEIIGAREIWHAAGDPQSPEAQEYDRVYHDKWDELRKVAKLQTDAIYQLADVLKSEGMSPELNAPCYKALLDNERKYRKGLIGAMQKLDDEYDEAHELSLRLSSKGV